jgi:hypothetical protein
MGFAITIRFLPNRFASYKALSAISINARAEVSGTYSVPPLHAVRAAREALMLNEAFTSEKAAALEMMKREIKRAETFTRWDDRWAMHLWLIAAEPSKYICWLTGHLDYDEDHTARLFLLATLHSIDRFFYADAPARKPRRTVRRQLPESASDVERLQRLHRALGPAAPVPP